MNCPRCNAPNPDGQRFCGWCGAPLPPPQQDPNYGYRKPEPNPNSNYNYSYCHQQQNQNFSQQNGYYQPPQKPKAFERTWFIVIMCICIPPVGILLLWISKRPRNIVVRVILTIFLVFYFMIGFGGLSSDNSGKDSSKSTKQETVSQEKSDDKSNNESKKEDSSESTEEPQLSRDDYIAQCQEVDYNDIMRNPDQYVGQKYKITVQIFSASEKWSAGTYYKAYTDDGSGSYFDKMVWIFDKRDENSEGYSKILEGDTVTFYGEFTGLQETKNALNGEKGEDFALDAYYADIIEEAQ